MRSMLCLALVAAATATYEGLGHLEEKVQTGELCDTVKQYSGYYHLTTGADKNYFYWAFESRGNPATDPVALWMTGGPGCSSEVALFEENGPCKVENNGTSTKLNPYSWNSNATLIYIDQPTGTGFSHGTGYDTNENQVATDMFDFLQQFFKGHPQFQNNDFFVFGESYGGHYVPATTHRIWKENQVPETGKLPINLKGVSIGNGLTDPKIQYQYYAKQAASTNNHQPIPEANILVMDLALPECLAAIDNCTAGIGQEPCVIALDICNVGLVEPYAVTKRNPYDMRINCEFPPLCYNFDGIAAYLARQDVRETLGVGNRTWSSCSKAVQLAMEGDMLKPFDQLIPDMLAAGINVQLYAGDQDFICNWLGNMAWAKALAWPGKDAFNAAPDTPWMVNGAEAGTFRTSGGFSFLRVYNAGHMVPLDQPAVALAMFNEFVYRK